MARPAYVSQLASAGTYLSKLAGEDYETFANYAKNLPTWNKNAASSINEISKLDENRKKYCCLLLTDNDSCSESERKHFIF